jgi:ABC-type uncharacterized transport system permease subunit
VSTARQLLSLVRVGWALEWAYRRATLLWLIGLAIQVALFTVIWRAIYHDRAGTVAGTDVTTAVGYVVLGLAVAGLFNTYPGESIEGRVREGLIAVDLLRPLGLLTQSLAQQAGRVIGALPSLVFTLGTGLAVGGLAAPAGAAAAGGFAISLVLAFLVSQLITLLMSLSSFWTLEVGGLNMMFGVLRMFMSGALLPLWFMPGWLQAIANALPVQAAT